VTLSHLETAARRHKQRLAARPERLTMWVPGWQGDLAARYRVIPEHDYKEWARRRSQRRDDTGAVADVDLIDLALEFLGNSCECVLSPDPEDDDKPRVAEDDHGPIAFDERLAGILSLDLREESKAAVVRALLTNEEGVFNVAAALHHADVVTAWITDTSQTVEGALAGE
jgi:NADPH-dependent glutamate synthase beta subunit-like oxidoreductase